MWSGKHQAGYPSPDMTTSGRPVVVVCPNLSGNCLGRATLLAELLLRSCRSVTVIGAIVGREIWAPAHAGAVDITGHRVRSVADLPGLARWIRARTRDAVVVVSKPLATSFGVALVGVDPGRMVLDIDDWERGLCAEMAGRRLASRVRDLCDPFALNSLASTIALEKLVGRAATRVVSNRFLQDRFGGTLLPHVRDPEVLRPDPARAESTRRELGLLERPWVGFIGTLREHKGVGHLVRALSLLRGPAAPGLLVAGVDTRDAYACSVVTDALVRLGSDRLRVIGQFPGRELPGLVEAPDVIALPSVRGPASVGQTPAKMFDAMAMARPVVATDVGDHAEILSDCGVIVPSGDDVKLSAAIAELVDDPARRRRLGEAARARLVSTFSHDVGAEVLRNVVDGIAS